ncbi:MAG: IS1634 family transposase, partial [Sphaerochaetaceae bacterium]|nr:IS1634 family transposase [Sphaerochaetaceae bacterium]
YLGYLDVLEKEYDDPIAHFKKVAAQMTKEYKEEHAPFLMKIDPNTKLTKITSDSSYTRKNIVYAALYQIYHELEIDYFINNRRRYTKAEYNHNAIFKLLVFDRILNPSSKRESFFHKDFYFDKMDFTLEDTYKSLDFFNKHATDMIKSINKQIEKQYKRDTTLVFYDVTNYYFEVDDIDDENDYRKKGVSKEHRPNPIIQMGLFMDEKGLPITYGIYPGNTNDCKTLIPSLMDIRYDYGMKDLIVVADKGMMSGDNLTRIKLQKNGYVISLSVKGTKVTDKFKKYVLAKDNWNEEYTKYASDGKTVLFKMKSQISPRLISVHSLKDGSVTKQSINEKQIIIYSKKYADKAKRDRRRAIEKALSKVGTSNKSNKYGSDKYIVEQFLDENNNVIKFKKNNLFDYEKLKEEEKYDGYYAIATNVIGLEEGEKPFRGKSKYTFDGFLKLNKTVTDKDILDMYKGLWKIEETFKVTKSQLKTRPVYVSTTEHIKAHFLSCYIALVILRLLEYRLGWEYSSKKLAKSMKLASGTLIESGYYAFDYYDEILEKLGNELDIDFSKKYLKLNQIKKIIGKTKKKP